jgi:hypothetical protein
MTAAAIERDPQFKGIIPAHGSLPAAASSKYWKGTMVGEDANGRAAVPVAAVATTPIVGVSSATFDNSAGANDAFVVEVDYGVFGFLIGAGGTPQPGDSVYALDNQTITLTKSTNSFAGVCTEVRTLGGVTYAFIFVNPFIRGTAQSAG